MDTTGLGYVDANAFVGRFGYKHALQPWRTGQLLAEYDRCGVAGALIWHGMAKSHAPGYGNRQLTAELAASDRLLGCWVALPHHVGDFPAPADFVDQLRAHDIRAVTLFPRTHGFEVDRRTTGELLDTLARVGVPVLLDAAEIGWAPLCGALAEHPDLAVILTNLSWSEERRLFPVLDEFPGLHVEFSALQSNRMLEVAYGRYGPDRLLFGTGAPFKSPGAARAFVDYARIPDEAKAAVAGGNLLRLLGGPRVPPARQPDHDEVARSASRGERLSIPVLDSHTHPVEDGGATGSGRAMIGGDIDSMIELYRAIGISKLSIAPWVGVNGGDVIAGNEAAASAMARYPDEVEAYARLDPNYDPDIGELARHWHVERKFRGVKPYYYNEHIAYTDDRYRPWWEVAEELCLYALVDPAIQSDEVYLEQIEALARRYPHVNIFMDHAGRSLEIAVKYAELAQRYRNLTVQLTYTTVTLGAIEYLVSELGPDKVLFGTDSAMRDPRPQIGWLAYANVDVEAKKQIFGGNFRRILDDCLV